MSSGARPISPTASCRCSTATPSSCAGRRADETIRLLGVDTPETHHPRKPVQCYGPEAAAYTTAQLFGQVVQLEDDVERHDIYGRRLAYVYLDGHQLRRVLLRQGYARLLVIEPNHAHARDMLDDELDARARGVGLWGVCES